MNKVFKVIWNHATQSWVAVSELASAKGKTKSKTSKLTALSVAVGSTLMGGNALAASAMTTDGIGNAYLETTTDKVLIGQTATNTLVGFDKTGVNVTVIGLNAHAVGNESIAIGYQVNASWNNSIAIGRNVQTGNVTVNPAENAVAIGSNINTLANDTVAIGRNINMGANLNSKNSYAIGQNITFSGNGNNIVGFGNNISARGGQMILIGNNLSGGNENSFIIGYNSTSSAGNTILIGTNVRASGANGTAIGRNATVTKERALALGYNTLATASNGIAIGQNATAGINGSGGNAMAIGSNTYNRYSDTIAIGTNATANNSMGKSGNINESVLIGAYSSLTGNPFADSNDGGNQPSTVVIGGRAVGAASGSTILGSRARNNANNHFGISQSTAVGSRSVVFGDQSSSLSSDTSAIGNSSLAIGGDDIDKARASILAAVPEFSQVASCVTMNEAITGNRNVSYSATQLPSLIDYLVKQVGLDIGTNTATVGNVSAAYQASTDTNVVTRRNALRDQYMAANSSLTSDAATVLAANDMATELVGLIYTSPGAATGNPNRQYTRTASIGDLSMALGQSAQSGGVGSNAIGINAITTGNAAIAFGTVTRALGNNSIAMGSAAAALSVDGTAIGHYALTDKFETTDTALTSVGIVNTTAAFNATAIGSRAHARANDAISIGSSSCVTGNSSIALGSNIDIVRTENSIVLGQGSSDVVGGVTKNTDGSDLKVYDSLTLTGASAPVISVTNATVRTSNNGVMEYEGFAGAVKNSGQYMSIGRVGAERQIKNLAPGAINNTSTDAINGSQLYAVMDKVSSGFNVYQHGANVTGKMLDENGALVDSTNISISPTEIVNFNNGTYTTANVTAFGTGANVTFNINNASINVTGTNNGDLITSGATAGALNTTTIADGVATTKNVAEAVNAAYWKVGDNATTVKHNVSAGHQVNFVNGTATYSEVTKEANGANNVTFHVNYGEGLKVVDGKLVTNVSAIDTTTLSNNANGTVAMPGTTNASSLVNASQVAGAINSAGWNTTLSNGTALNVNPGDAVNYVNGNGTTANITATKDANGKDVVNVSFNVTQNSVGTQNPNGTVKIKDTTNGTSTFLNAKDTVDLINNASFNVTTAKNDVFANNQAGKENATVKAGSNITYTAGKNIAIAQKGSNFTFSTTKDVTFENAMVNQTFTVGNGTGATNLTSTVAGLNVSSATGGKQAIVNVKSTLPGTADSTVIVTETARTLPTLTSVQKATAATIDDVLNAGWNLRGQKTAGGAVEAVDFVKPYDTVTFVSGNNESLSVVTTVNGDNNVSTIAISPNTTALTTTVNNNGTLSVPTTSNGANLVNASVVAGAVNAVYWKVGDNATTVKHNVSAGHQVNFVNGTATYSEVTKEANGANNVTFHVNYGEGLKVVDGKLVTNVSAIDTTTLSNNANGTVVTPTTNASSLVNASQVAGAINSAGWNTTLSNGTALNVNPGDAVNYVNGNGTTANIIVAKDANGKDVVNVSFNVAQNSVGTLNANGTVTIADTTNGTSTFLNAKDTVALINSASFNVTTAKNDVFAENQDGKKNVPVKAGGNITYTAGKNIAIAQNGSNFTFSTTKDVTFENANVTSTLAIGNASSTSAPVVNLKTENATTANVNPNASNVTSALNITDANGNATQITGVASSLNTMNVTTFPAGTTNTATGGTVDKLLNLGNTTNPLSENVLNSVATVRDLTNLGWIVSADGNNYTDTVKNANEVKFNGLNGITVTGNTSDKGVRLINISIASGTVDGNATTGKAENGTTNFVTGEQVQNAINNSGWLTNVTQTNATTGATETATKVVTPGTQVNYVNGNGTTANITVAKDANGKDVVSVSYDVNTGSITAANSDATVTTTNATTGASETIANPNRGKVTVATGEGDKVATVQNVADAINSAKWIASVEETNEEITTSTASDAGVGVGAGDELSFKAGKNLKIKRDGQNITYALANDINVTTVTATSNITVGVGPNATTINQGSISNLNDHLTAPTNATSTVTNATATTLPSNVSTIGNQAATVNDVLNAGWNLKANGEAVDAVTHGNNVNFASNDGSVIITPTTDRASSTLNFAVNATSVIKSVTGVIGYNADGQATISGDGTRVATVDEVKDAINNTGWKLSDQLGATHLITPSSQIVRYVDGNGTTSKVDLSDDGTTVNISYSVKQNAAGTQNANGTVTIADTANGTSTFLNAKDTVDLINSASFNVTTAKNDVFVTNQ